MTSIPDDRGRRERKKAQTKEAIRQAALALFDEKGFAATTITDITDRVDVSRRTFFRYYRSKEDILRFDLANLIPRMRQTLLARPLDEPPLISILESLQGLMGSDGPPRVIFRLRTDVPGGALGKRVFAILAEWEQTMIDTLLERWGADLSHPSEAMALRASVIARAVTSALRASIQSVRTADTEGRHDPGDFVGIVRQAFQVLIEGCPLPEDRQVG